MTHPFAPGGSKSPGLCTFSEPSKNRKKLVSSPSTKDLFDQNPTRRQGLAPLPERLRARQLDQVVGQEHLTGDKGLLRRMLEVGRLESMIFWGPPGCGKTTVARLLIEACGAIQHQLNAVTSGVADLRKVIATAEEDLRMHGERSVLFIDEIHRFNKAQQDALLRSVEDGTITLLAATTENPGFEVIRPLQSRCHVLQFEALTAAATGRLLDRALEEDEWLRARSVRFAEGARDYLLEMAGGDGRKLLQYLEMVVTIAREEEDGCLLSRDTMEQAMLRRSQPFDKGGDMHYDMVSAFIKSVRGSDADAAIYWLARMLEAGEDPVFVARRLLILASEDIGNASPNGLVLANACFEAVHKLGMPEAMYPLAQCTAYLAGQPKSNACCAAIAEARSYVRNNAAAPVPLHLRNSPTNLSRSLGHSDGYQYPPNFDGSFVTQQYLPVEVNQVFYRPQERGTESRIRAYLKACWPEREL